MHSKDIKFRLIKENKIIGYLYIFEDDWGGGLNGGISFSTDGKIFYDEIPLFEKCNRFTGFRMNDQDIYAGDIFKCRLAKKHPYSVVIWDEKKAKFMLEIIGGEKEGERYAGLTQAVHNEYELVGNIFDNSDLIKN